MNILFISANRVGDAVLTTGILSWLVDRYPDASFTIACGPYGAGIFSSVPRLKQLVVMKKKKLNGHWIDLWKSCIGTKWDLIVDLRNSAVSRLLFARKLAIHKKVGGVHKVVENARILGLSTPPDPYIWLSPEAIKQAAALVPPKRPVLALGPAANWPHKQWPIDHFVKLAERITSTDGALPNALVMVLADNHECEQIASLLNAIPDDRRIEIIGQSLQTAAACLKKARLYVGNDSGLMHLAAALRVPTLGLFGPGFPEIYGPWGKKCAYVTTPETREELLGRLAKKEPLSTPLMSSLGVEQALAAANDLIGRTQND